MSLSKTEYRNETGPLHHNEDLFLHCRVIGKLINHDSGVGYGLFAEENIPKGTPILSFCGELLSREQATPVALLVGFTKDGEEIFLESVEEDGRERSIDNIINHHCHANAKVVIPNEITETGGRSKPYQVYMEAIEDIPAGTEITIFYPATEYEMKGEEIIEKCRDCGGKITGYTGLSEKEKWEHRDEFVPHIRKILEKELWFIEKMKKIEGEEMPELFLNMPQLFAEE